MAECRDLSHRRHTVHTMFEELSATTDDPAAELDRMVLAFDRPLEPCPRCGGLLPTGHLEAADAGWLEHRCPSCGVVLAA